MIESRRAPTLDLLLPTEAYPGLDRAVRGLRAALLVAAHESAPSAASVEASARDVARGICQALEVPPPEVHVLDMRPRLAVGELHGRTTRTGPTSRIEVWMRTSLHESVVSFRAFLRTLCHELVHHLDHVLHGVAESRHTEAFFRREASLLRQLDLTHLLGRQRRPRPQPPESETPEARKARLRARVVPTEQPATAPPTKRKRKRPATDPVAPPVVVEPAPEPPEPPPSRGSRAKRRTTPIDRQIALPGFDEPGRAEGNPGVSRS